MRNKNEWIEGLLDRFPEGDKVRAQELLSDYWECAKILSMDLEKDISPIPYTVGGIVSVIALESLTSLDPISKALITVTGSLMASELTTKQTEKNVADQAVGSSPFIHRLQGVLTASPDSLSDNLSQLQYQLSFVRRAVTVKNGAGIVGGALGGIAGYCLAPLESYPEDKGVIAMANSNVYAMVGHTAARALVRVGLYKMVPDENKSEPAPTNGLRRRPGRRSGE
ncbi:MAG TPA: hypothetical protein VLJ15_03600 [Gammaproteobacteria bacterium]|nr:hypothetical protein [Gammaproteobacteria bacterium]